MRHGQILLFSIGIGGLLALPMVFASLFYNVLNLVSVNEQLVGSVEEDVFWYGLGTHISAGREAAPLVEDVMNMLSTSMTCSEVEERLLQIYTRLPIEVAMGREYRNIILNARQMVCSGRPQEALQLLRDFDVDGFVPQQILLAEALGRDSEKVALATHTMCPPDAEWCQWCVQQMDGRKDQDAIIQAAGDTAPALVNRHSNDSEGRFNAAELNVPIPLTRQQLNIDLAPTTITPLIITYGSIDSYDDNFIEYESLPMSASALRFRVSGVLLATEEVEHACIAQRLILQDKDEHVLGEAWHRPIVNGKFELEMWWPLTSETSQVTPRISFDKSCLDTIQQIAICAVDLAVIPSDGE
jgi:hypothetical protein